MDYPSSLDDQDRPGPEVFATLDDPWSYLTQIRKLEGAARTEWLYRWLQLVARRDALIQDALLNAGKELFKYTLGAVRKELDKIQSELTKDRLEYSAVSPAVVGDGVIAE